MSESKPTRFRHRVLEDSPRGRYERYRLAVRATRRLPYGQRLADATAPLVLGRTARVRANEVRLPVDGLSVTAPRRFLHAFAAKPYEPLFVEWLEQALGPGGTAVDVGAHVGYLTMRMARVVGPTGGVVAIEPSLDNVAFIQRNLARNGIGNVTVLAVAIDATDGVRWLNLGDASDSYSFYEHPNAATRRRVPVPTRTLDSLVDGDDPVLARVDVVKIDAEGAEPEILAGMTRLLARFPDVQLGVEWNPKMSVARGHRLDAVPRLLEGLGRPLAVLDDTRGRTLSVEEALQDLADPELLRVWYSNVVTEGG